MKLLANENVPLPTVEELRRQGHDIRSVSLDSPGIPDEEVLLRAHREERVLLTFDRDYGMLVYRRRLPVPPAILYLRFQPQTPIEAAARLQPLLASGEKFMRGFFVVLERDACRRRPLPSAQQ